MIQAAKLVEKFRETYTERWGYIWGAAGRTWTESDQSEAERNYASAVTSGDAKKIERWEMTAKYGKKWIGRKVADCSGLFAWAYKQFSSSIPHGSNSIWDNSLRNKGELKSGRRTDGQTLLPGTAVFKLRNGNDYYHIGLYAGNDKVIEAQGTKAGVVISSIKQWHSWGELKAVNYEKEVTPVSEVYSDAIVNVSGGVNLREAASTSSNRIMTIPMHATLGAVKTSGEWTKAQYAGKNGYVMTKFITFDVPAASNDNADALKLIASIEKELAQLKTMLQA